MIFESIQFILLKKLLCLKIRFLNIESLRPGGTSTTGLIYTKWKEIFKVIKK